MSFDIKTLGLSESPKKEGWRLFLDSEFLWTFFSGDNKWLVSERRGCRDKAPARFSEHCDVPRLG